VSFLESLKNDFTLFHSNIDDYKRRVDSISNLFSLTSDNRLMSDMSPSGFSGNYDSGNSIVLFSLNPGYSAKFNPSEQRLQNGDWEQYCRARKSLYLFFKKVNHPSPYYHYWWILFKGLLQEKSYNYDTQWDYFNKKLVNLNLIPYHSKGLQLPTRFDEEQNRYLIQNFNSLIDFIMPYSPKLLIFNGNPWLVLLKRNSLLNEANKIEVTERFNLYFFKLYKMPAVLMDKFFSAQFWGIKNDPHRSRIIPELIKRQTNLVFD
jgi:hypothetical protein